MKTGDLVKIIQWDDVDALKTPFEGKVGVIIQDKLEKFVNQEGFSVMIDENVHVFGGKYLEIVGRDLSDEQLENVVGGMSSQMFSEWRAEKINEIG